MYVYLDEPTIDDYEDNEDFDVLKYWKTKETSFPILFIMVQDVLNISFTIMTSELALSKGGHVLSKVRSFVLLIHV